MEQISLRDQNNNIYLMTASELEYRPVRKEESSSGVYSGGEPKTILLEAEQWSQIKALVQAILDNKSIQIEERRMLTAFLTITDSLEQKERYIITRSEELSALLSYLKSVLDI